MKMGIVGPVEFVNKTHVTIKESYPRIELVDLIYKEAIEAPDLVQNCQVDLDAVIFLGKTPFKLTEKFIKQNIVWEYLPRHGSTLLRTLLEASALKKYNILSVSFDTFTRDFLYEVYDEIGFKREDFNFFIAEQKLTQKNYIDYVYRFHCNNYYTKKVSCCITGLAEIYDKLYAKNIPCVLVTPIKNVILTTVEKLRLEYLAQSNTDNQIVVMVVQIDFPNEYSVIRDDEYQNIISRMKISECVYLFASKIKAAVVEVNHKEYMIFTTKKILETVTNNYEKIYLFELVEEKVLKTISLGIGYGSTAQEAKFNAYTGLNKAIRTGGNEGFVVYENGETRGPLNNKSEKRQLFIDKRLSNISEKTGISINTIYKIYNAAEKCNNYTFSSKELANLCEMSKRSVDRFIQKLELYDFCETVGKKMVYSTGRPSRVIKLTFF
ncbi:hypothetical protein [Clostridium magnum]|uniref:Transcriptional regulator n=1 Tax=Clostridium magnum DSM 2767 TaxID=1121326 RepID=A0A162RQS0_9CLOT|nr:hypothetical protein [Clostridium magnum]KZL90250.1 hypothetical protein CLMAG_40210 [Clostridium magnum DSM 2767]SHI13807.1 hypothetical protein SAMN02745944_02671 [Clostridium magnum DSM 2767]